MSEEEKLHFEQLQEEQAEKEGKASRGRSASK